MLETKYYVGAKPWNKEQAIQEVTEASIRPNLFTEEQVYLRSWSSDCSLSTESNC